MNQSIHRASKMLYLSVFDASIYKKVKTNPQQH